MGRLTERDWKNPQSTMWAKVDLHIKNPHYNVGVSRALQKLAKYEDLEEQGRLIELPCAVGDMVWTYWIDDEKLGVERYKPANEPLCILVKDLWGIKFFATKEEAEEEMIAKLKELEG